MKQTVVGAFDQYSAAQRAADYLASQGIERDHIHVQATDNADSGYRSSTTTTTTDTDEHGSRGVMASVRSFFSEVFGPDKEHEDLHHYAETIRRGGAVVAVDVDEETQVTEVCRKLKNAGAIDLDQRVSEWRSTGWSGFDEGVSPAYAADRTSTTDTMGTTAAGTTAGTTTTGTAGMRADTEGRVMQENVVPVVQEDIEIGKRMVEQGGIRVYSHVVEQPVHESVDLRSEKAVVERRPVDRPLSDADAAAFQDRTIEVRETAEKAVVSKTAHVVEEVRVGKEVQHQTQDIDDTVRRTEVEVQRLDGSDLRSDADYDASVLGYREHWNQNYSALGGSYDDYDPAYRYGHSLARDERYRGRDWAAMEPEVRRDWEGRHPESTWERVKDSVRHAWERARSSMHSNGGATGTTAGTTAGTTTGSYYGSSYDTHAGAYRDHFDRNYSHMGAVYDEYEPAYRYGNQIATESRYKGQDWDTIEASARSDWEARNASSGNNNASTWDRVKGAVRHAWERAKS